MKQLLKLSLLLLALLLPVTAIAHDFEVDGIYYIIINDNEAAVTYSPSSHKYSGNVTIPATINYDGATFFVTGIGGCAFAGCEGLTSITIPYSIRFIDDDAFYSCTKLRRVNITDIAAWCRISFYGYLSNPLCYAHHLFLNGSEITNLVISESVTSISSWAFFDCDGLSNVTIPKGVTSIGVAAFLECDSLKTLNFNAISCCNFEEPDGNFWDPPFHHLNISSLNIGDSVQRIPDYFALGLESLTNITIPNSVTYIGHLSFCGCSGVTSVNIPNSVTAIGNDAFSFCSELNEVYSNITDPSSVSLGYNVFSCEPNNYDVRTLYVPYGTLAAYQNDTRWSQYFGTIVEMEPEPDFISDGVYYSITGDNKVVISRGEETYSGRMVIPESVTVDGVTYTVTGIADGAFANANLDFLSIPVAITDNIANNAFEDSFIESVYITGEGAWADGALPSSVDTLYISSGVTSVEGLQVNPSVIYSYAAVPPTCDANAFTDYHAELVVPASSLAAYFTAPYWCNFINIMGYAVEPTGLSLENDSISILAGNLIQMKATFTPDNATPQQVFWTSTNDSIAKVGPTNGELFALKAGECDIKARLLDKVAVCHVTVTEIAPTQVTLSQEFAKMEVGSQLTLTATVLPEDATDKAVTWSTTNSAVAAVDSLGNVMAIGPGECFLTATCRDKQAICHVIVVEHFINIQLDQHELLLLPNHIELLTPTVTPVSTDLAVTSTNPSVAAARLANGKIQVVGIAEGTTTIRVNSTDGYAEPDSCVVKVYTLRGDVNGDGFVNISDATFLISYLLEPQSVNIHEVNADTNNDGQINISDATRLISYLLTGEELVPKDENEYRTETISVKGVSFDMVSVDGGNFMMGAKSEQGDEARDKEKPLH